MTTQLTEAGQKLTDELVRAGVLTGYLPDSRAAKLNTAAQILLTPEGGGGMREATWHGKDRRPDVGRKFVALYDDGSGAALLYRHDDGFIDSDGDDYQALKDCYDWWAYLPDDFEFRCELVSNDGEPTMHLPVFALAPRTSVPGNDAGMREALVQCRSELASLHHGDCDMAHAEKHSAGLRMANAALSPPTGSAGDDETGVREAMGDGVPESVRRFVEHCEHKVYPLVHAHWALNHSQLNAFIDALKAARAALAPPPPKAETPAGVGEDAVEAASAAFYDTMIGSEREFWPHHEGWAGKGETFKAKVRGRMRTALEAALSLAPAARAGDGVERYKAGAMDMRDAAANAISAAGSRLLRDKGDALCVAVLGDAALMVRALPLTAAPAANGDGA